LPQLTALECLLSSGNLDPGNSGKPISPLSVNTGNLIVKNLIVKSLVNKMLVSF
jgi:hypothetical protein